MKIKLYIAALLGLGLVAASAQPGRMGGMGGGGFGPQFSGGMTKLFGANTAFSAAIETHAKISAGAQPMELNLPGKIAFDAGKTRFEMDMSDMKGGGLPPGAAEQMKAMGMDKMVMVSRPDKKLIYLVYPGLQSYAEMPLQDPDATKSEDEFKMDKVEQGKETVDGHACVKNKVTISDDKGNKREFLTWNATDMKDFPVKIEFSEAGNTMSMQLKNVKLAKPDAAQFDPPAGYKGYQNIMQLMQEVASKRMGGPGGMGGPPKN